MKKNLLIGKQLPLPVVKKRNKFLSDEIYARTEISDGRNILVIVYQGDGGELQVAEEIFNKLDISVCTIESGNLSKTFIERNDITTYPSYIIYMGGHEVYRRVGEINFEDVCAWVSERI